MSVGRRRPMMLLIPLVWLAVVVVVAGVTWRVIDSAGRHVLTSGGPPPLSASGTTERADDGREPADPTPKHRDGRKEGSAPAEPSGEPGPSRSAAPGSSEPSPTPSAQPTPLPSQLPEQQQPSRQPSQQPPAQPPSSEPPPSQTQVRSWQGSAGTVTAACTGTRISLQSVTPNDGWAVEVGDRGPEHIEVKFESGGEEERETEVRAACSGGVPRFQVEAED